MLCDDFLFAKKKEKKTNFIRQSDSVGCVHLFYVLWQIFFH